MVHMVDEERHDQGLMKKSGQCSAVDAVPGNQRQVNHNVDHRPGQSVNGWNPGAPDP